jgi:hypothetical protein
MCNNSLRVNLIFNYGDIVKKIIPLTGLLVLGSLAACSENNTAEQQSTDSTSAVAFNGASANTGNESEGVWGFCNDKSTSVTASADSCQTIDAAIWHMDNGELTALEVTNTQTEGCLTDCFDLNNEELQTKVLAKGHYELYSTGYSFTITESSDEKKYPKCTVNWDFGDKVADDLVEWKFKNVNCELPEINYSAWARKYTGQVN